MNVRVGTVEWAALFVHSAWAARPEHERMVRAVWPQLGDALDTLDEIVVHRLVDEE